MNRKSRCVDLFGSFSVITEKLQQRGRMGWVGTEWLGLNEEKNSKGSKGGGDGGVSYLPHLVIPTQKENCVGILLEWWLFIWKEAA